MKRNEPAQMMFNPEVELFQCKMISKTSHDPAPHFHEPNRLQSHTRANFTLPVTTMPAENATTIVPAQYQIVNQSGAATIQQTPKTEPHTKKHHVIVILRPLGTSHLRRPGWLRRRTQS